MFAPHFNASAALSARLRRILLTFAGLPTRVFASAIFTLLFLTQAAHAQVSLTGANDPYTQNFNSYVGTAASVPAGWTVSFSGTPTFRGVGTGTSANGGAWAYGTGGDNSFGALRSTATGNLTLGVSFTNNTGVTLTSLTIALNYEQWRYANTSGFSVSGTGALSSSNLSSLNFTGSPTGTDGTPTTTAATLTLTGLSITNNSTFGINWLTTDPALADNGIALDDFSLTYSPVPEPAPFAAGGLALLGVLWQQRRRVNSLFRLRAT